MAISTIQFRHCPEEPEGREVRIIIDDKDMIQHLEETYQIGIGQNKTWSERGHVMLNGQALMESMVSSGKYPIFVCSCCFDTEYADPEDVMLREVEVEHDEEYIFWKVTVWCDFKKDHSKQFTFHRPQLEAALKRVRVSE